jgi:hypothetical protein
MLAEAIVFPLPMEEALLREESIPAKSSYSDEPSENLIEMIGKRECEEQAARQCCAERIHALEAIDPMLSQLSALSHCILI